MREHTPASGAKNSVDKFGGSGPFRWRHLSGAVVAFVLFLGVNALWSKTDFGLLSPLDYPVATWTGTAIEDFFRTTKQRPQMVFLGSSLMVTPLMAVDANFLHKSIDAPYHHKSLFFEEAFKRVSGLAVRTFNFAIPGEMPSDAYLITKLLLKDDRRPDVIVYGVGPRDFLDNLLPGVKSTDPYKHLAKLAKRDGTVPREAQDGLQAFNSFLNQNVFLYENKTDLACATSRLVSRAVIPHLPPETPQQEWEYKQMVFPNYHEFEVLPTACLAAPTKPGSDHAFHDNLDEYRDRYKDLKWETFINQSNCFAKTLATARERGTHAVVVAMPITDGNRSLIPEFVWHLYTQNLRVLAAANGADFIDAQSLADFTPFDFGDTVHLNAKGGLKLLNVIAAKAAQSPFVSAALQPHKIGPSDLVPSPSLMAGVKGHQL